MGKGGCEDVGMVSHVWELGVVSHVWELGVVMCGNVCVVVMCGNVECGIFTLTEWKHHRENAKYA